MPADGRFIDEYALLSFFTLTQIAFRGLLHSGKLATIICIVSGGPSGVEPPVPISNTEVKHPSADDTAWATGWENRSLPGALVTNAPAGRLNHYRLTRRYT